MAAAAAAVAEAKASVVHQMAGHAIHKASNRLHDRFNPKPPDITVGFGSLVSHCLPGFFRVSTDTGPSHADCLRQVPGDVPNWRLNARLNAASDS